MNNSNLYRIHPESKTLQSIREIDFSDHSFQERCDIQEWVEATPAILGEKLLIIAKEKTYFEGTNERPDLIGIDKDGNVVIIELKRDDSGSEVYWQAIKYASYWSRFSPDDILEVYVDYINKYKKKEGTDEVDEGTEAVDEETEEVDEGTEEVDEEYAKQEIIDFIGQDSVENINNRQRMILVSHRFSKEVISAAEWLIENYGMDIRCVQLIPYFDEDKKAYYLQSNTILPLPGIDEYLIKPCSGKAGSPKSNRGSRNDDNVTKFCEKLRDELIRGDALIEDLKPTRYSRWAGESGNYRYYRFWFKEGLWDNWNLSYQVRLSNDSEQKKNSEKEATVSLRIRKKHLLENGVTERQIRDLEYKLQTMFETNNEFSFRSQNDTLLAERVLEYSELNDSLRKELAQSTSGLISDTFNVLIQILSDNEIAVQQGAVATANSY